MTCHSHGWKYLSPFEWDDDSNALHFVLTIDGRSVDVAAVQDNKVVEAELTSFDKFKSNQIENAREMIVRSLGLRVDTTGLLEKVESIKPEYADLVRGGAGRLLRSPTLWEDAAKTLFTTNCSWALTKLMCQNVCSETFSDPAPSGRYPFAEPKKISKYEQKNIRELIPVGYRAEYLLLLSHKFSKDPSFNNIESNGYGSKEAFSMVRKLKGFGDYATNHLLVMAGYYDRIPVDSEVIAYLKRNYKIRKPNAFIKRNYGKWREYKWWGFRLEKTLNRQNWIGD